MHKVLQKNKLIALLSILLVLSNIFFISVFAWNKLDLNLFTIKKDNANAQNGDVEVKPGDTIHLLLSWKNGGDSLTNIKAELSFSSNNFTYPQQTSLNSYKNWVKEVSNIDTNTFNPPILNIAPIASEAPTGTYLDLYYIHLLNHLYLFF